MLEFHEVSLKAESKTEQPTLIHDLSTQLPEGHLCGIIGPPRSGKSALLEAVAGVRVPCNGRILWKGRHLGAREVGLVAQHGVAEERLSVRENISASLALRASGFDRPERTARIEEILTDCGLGDVAGHRAGALDESGQRRLAVAIEMAGSPPILACDDLVAGLDARGEIDLLKQLKQLATNRHYLVLATTDAQRHVRYFDSVVVLYCGMIAYHGPGEFLPHYFHLEKADDLFPTLARRTASEWYRSWLKHREPYHEKVTGAAARTKSTQTRIAELFSSFRVPGTLQADSTVLAELPPVPPPPPGTAAQAAALLSRRFRVFLRNPAHLGRVAAATLGAPWLAAWWINHDEILVPSALAGLLLFLGAWNGAGEIAKRRRRIDAEKRSGVSIRAVLLSTGLVCGLIAAVQAMCVTEIFRRFELFPSGAGRYVVLVGVTIFAMTLLCAAISSFARTAERAALISAYFVGVQLMGVAWAGTTLLQAWTPAGAFLLSALAGSGDQSRFVLGLAILTLHVVIGFALVTLGLTERRTVSAI